MAILRTETRICDICGNAEQVTRYRISYIERARSLTTDLCSEHDSVLRELGVKLGSEKTPGARKVSTLAEVERAKKTARRKKPAGGS